MEDLELSVFNRQKSYIDSSPEDAGLHKYYDELKTKIEKYSTILIFVTA